MITKYGVDVVLKMLLIAVVVNGAVWFLVQSNDIRIAMLGISAFLVLFTLFFFRDPERSTPLGGNLIISPADGRVVLVKEVMEAEFLKDKALQVSIFLSPLDVHVNRFPISGEVRYFKYFPGKYLVAFAAKSSVTNERTFIGIENGTFKILFKQIAGFVARRIVADVKVGTKATAGNRFGMIKFGSRVDVLMPVSCEVKVRLRDRVVAGETVLAVER